MSRYSRFLSADNFGLAVIIAIGCIIAVPKFPGAAHVDAANLFALCASLVFGLEAVSGKKSLLRSFAALYIAMLPLAIRTLISGCYDTQGWLLFFTIPSSSLLFTLGLTSVFPDRITKARIAAFFLLWILIGLGGFLFTFYNAPGVAYKNPVWGWWPGPVYDYAARPDKAVFIYFAASGFLGAAFLLWDFFGKRGVTKQAAASYYVIGTAGLLWYAAPLQQDFDRTFQLPLYTGKIVVHGSLLMSSDEAATLGTLTDLHLRDLENRLQTSITTPVHLYLYADDWDKHEKTGAFQTSYVPVWLKRPQIHLTRADVAGTVRHELVHVLLKQHGNQLFGASWNGALIEGAATALAPDRSDRFTLHELVRNGQRDPDEIRNLFSPFSFYTSRSGVGYTMAGSFLQWLLEQYPKRYFLEAYASGDLEKYYGVPADTLVAHWKQFLSSIPENDETARRTAALYGAPALFETPCARTLNPAARLLDRAGLLEARKGAAAAAALLGSSAAAVSNTPALWLAHSRLALLAGTKTLPWAGPPLPAVLLRQADAALLAGDEARAAALRDSALTPVGDSTGAARWRADSNWRFEKKTWQAVLHARYQPEKLAEEEIPNIPEEELIRLLRTPSPAFSGQHFEKNAGALKARYATGSWFLRLSILEAFTANGHFSRVKPYLSILPPETAPARIHERFQELTTLLSPLE